MMFYLVSHFALYGTYLYEIYFDRPVFQHEYIRSNRFLEMTVENTRELRQLIMYYKNV